MSKKLDLLLITLDPQTSYSDGYNIDKISLDVENLEQDEVEDLIAEEVQMPEIGGFPRYGIALNKEQAKILLEKIKEFLYE